MKPTSSVPPSPVTQTGYSERSSPAPSPRTKASARPTSAAASSRRSARPCSRAARATSSATGPHPRPDVVVPGESDAAGGAEIGRPGPDRDAQIDDPVLRDALLSPEGGG